MATKAEEDSPPRNRIDRSQQVRMANEDEEEERQKNLPAKQIHGLLVSYTDDEINECVHSALKGKKRVHYKCMDVHANYVAFGTSVGAIYLFRLTTVTHSSCKLALVVPCDQGSIEVIKFAPGPPHQPSDLVVSIGTLRGSLVIFQLSSLDEQNLSSHEIYRAEEFTKSMHASSIGIKFIEYDLLPHLDDPYQSQSALGGGGLAASFSKVYICDQKDRIFVLESSSIYPTFRLLYSQKPSHVLSVDESTVHQICVHRSHLLMSTDEKTRIFNEHSNELVTIGKKQRKVRGFFGACFLDPNYRPARLLGPPATGSLSRSRGALATSQQTMYSSTNSVADLDNVLIFIARPKFSLWQVNIRREVMFTHIFDPLIKATPPLACVGLLNAPIKQLSDDNHSQVEQIFDPSQRALGEPKSDHFERLIPIFSTTLGNLLLSHTRHELFVVDPTGARVIVWYCQEKPISQVCCSENEIFVLSEISRRQFQVDRLILLAPTQFVLELHRINRFLSLTVFVEIFCEQFRQLMALPLSGPNTITTEGGLLRNIIWNTWRECVGDQTAVSKVVGMERYAIIKRMVDDIIEESQQLKQSIENLADSRLLFTISNENVERLCSEPYASMVSLDISIANLHSSHVVHFSQEALQRHKSIARLSQSILNLNKLRRAATQSSLMLNEPDSLHDFPHLDPVINGSLTAELNKRAKETALATSEEENRVIVERMPVKQTQREQPTNKDTSNSTFEQARVFSVVSERAKEEWGVETGTQVIDEEIKQPESVEEVDRTRCPNCKWPKPRAHLKPMHHSQQIQFNYIQENLIPNFEENIDMIYERAFRHGLWHLVLKCFAFRNNLTDYITCCIMLDDVRLLNVERFIITQCGEDELFERVFELLNQKLDDIQSDEKGKVICFRCKNELRLRESHTNDDCDHDDNQDDSGDGHEEEEEENQFLENIYNKQPGNSEDDISFNLVNLFRKFMLRRDANVRKAVHRLLQHPDLLNRSKIQADFYLQAIVGQCVALRRTRFKA